MEIDLDITPQPDLGPLYLSTFSFPSGVKFMFGMTVAPLYSETVVQEH